MFEYLILAVVILLLFIVIIRSFLPLTIKMCDPNIPMKGKVVIVTGANSGLGYETAKDIARRGARVILACRNINRGTEARDRIIKETGNKNVVFKQVDLASFKSVRQFAKHILETETELHVLINNAGLFCNEKSYTEDGILMTMQVNYFAPYLLTQLLLPLLKNSQPSRIINLSSILNLIGRLNFENDNESEFYNGILAYANSKLCILMSTIELSKKLKDTGIVVNALHPGFILTNITSYSSNIFYRFLFAIACWFNNMTDETGAQTSIYLAASDEGGRVSGKYFVNCSTSFMVSPKTRNENLRKELWEYSNKVVKFEDSCI